MPASRIRAALALGVAVAVGPGCVTLTFTSWHTNREVSGDGELRVGEDDLAAALARLGAPTLVRENGDGAVLAWGWADEGAWGTTLSVPVSDSFNASFRYEDTDLGLEGVALFFDASWVLTAVRRGPLADVLPPAQARARSSDDLEGTDGG